MAFSHSGLITMDGKRKEAGLKKTVPMIPKDFLLKQVDKAANRATG